MEDVEVKENEVLIVKEYKKAKRFSRIYAFSSLVCSLIIFFGFVAVALYLGLDIFSTILIGCVLVAIYVALVWSTWLYIAARKVDVEGSYFYLRNKQKEKNDIEHREA